MCLNKFEYFETDAPQLWVKRFQIILEHVCFLTNLLQ